MLLPVMRPPVTVTVFIPLQPELVGKQDKMPSRNQQEQDAAEQEGGASPCENCPLAIASTTYLPTKMPCATRKVANDELDMAYTNAGAVDKSLVRQASGL